MPSFRKKPVVVEARPAVAGEVVHATEGDTVASEGDWIIAGATGEYVCPKAAFEKNYESVEEIRYAKRFDFGLALCALKSGKRVRRAGWNGKGMWLALTQGSHIDGAQARSGAAQLRAAEAGHPENPCILTIGAHIDMRAADGSLVIGWLASQTDMLATDWEVVS